ncbi:MAG: RluA family pseudouridine synthase [Candidatus Doudnabacteria bacterium]|jgi:23S rRNA pseudouridine1911/1915/1917 synthase
MEHNLIVKDLKTRLDKYLAQELKDISRSQIQRDIEAGLVLVNGVVIKVTKFVVRLNDVIKYQVSSIKNEEKGITATNTPLKVLYNNNDLLIIDKPAGMVVHPGAGFKGETLASALLFNFSDIAIVGEEHRPGIVHRLDKDTSGIILVAKTQKMYEFLKDAFAERKIKKEYLALVLGHMEKRQGFIDSPMGKSRSDFRKQTTKNPVEAKDALTEYKVLEYLGAGESEVGSLNSDSGIDQSDILKHRHSDTSDLDKYTLILVKLHTGRTHQIRVHFASIDHPLIGDELYGRKKIKLAGLKRQFLHAKRIEVQLPDETWIEAESELAPDLKEVLINLGSKIVKTL